MQFYQVSITEIPPRDDINTKQGQEKSTNSIIESSKSSPPLLQSKAIKTKASQQKSVFHQKVSTMMNRNEAAKIIQAAIRAKTVCNNIGISTVAQGITLTKINQPVGLGRHLSLGDTPAGEIKKQIQHGATYHRLSIHGGALKGNVIGTSFGDLPKPPPQILADSQASRDTAFINGGFFVHKKGLVDNEGKELLKTGQPVGKTQHRSDYLHIPEPWKQDYGYFLVGNDVGVSCAPLLSLKGEKIEDTGNDERFRYRVSTSSGKVEENLLNKRAGALTHAGDNNERSGISIGSDNSLSMHTLTAQGERAKGVTMEKWQEIISLANPNDVSSSNLDGGGSVFMGVVNSDEKVEQISRGGNPSLETRPLANMIVSKSINNEHG